MSCPDPSRGDVSVLGSLPTAGPATEWLSVKEAAFKTTIPARTLSRWAASGLILADRLASGVGQWLIAINAHGRPISRKPFTPAAPERER
jgi:hypothetical protein